MEMPRGERSTSCTPVFVTVRILSSAGGIYNLNFSVNNSMDLRIATRHVTTAVLDLWRKSVICQL